MKKKRIWKLLCCLLLMTALILPRLLVSAGQSTVHKEKGAESVPAVTMSTSLASHSPVQSAVTAQDAPLNAIQTATWTAFRQAAEPAISREALQDLYLYPGGMPFGIKFYTDGVTVVGFCDVETQNGSVNPANLAGLRIKDVILQVNGEVLTGANRLTDLIENSNGKPLRLLLRRGKEELETTLTPVYCPAESRYKTGIWVRDCGAGIGTVTFILPDTGAFAGLGHGICDADTGALVAMRRGTVSDVTISSVVRGAAGAPGELKGYFNAGKVGALLGNSACGVWGVFSEVPECVSEPLPVGLRNELEEGDAYILCTLDTNKIERYDVRITNIHRDAAGSKCFTVTVTDPDLLAVTGGIVQGMSGSPIIQNGKIVGAVTHVLINDPTTGYGIFIENMLNAAQMPMARAS